MTGRPARAVAPGQCAVFYGDSVSLSTGDSGSHSTRDPGGGAGADEVIGGGGIARHASGG